MVYSALPKRLLTSSLISRGHAPVQGSLDKQVGAHCPSDDNFVRLCPLAVGNVLLVQQFDASMQARAGGFDGERIQDCLGIPRMDLSLFIGQYNGDFCFLGIGSCQGFRADDTADKLDLFTVTKDSPVSRRSTQSNGSGLFRRP